MTTHANPTPYTRRRRANGNQSSAEAVPTSRTNHRNSSFPHKPPARPSNTAPRYLRAPKKTHGHKPSHSHIKPTQHNKTEHHHQRTAATTSFTKQKKQDRQPHQNRTTDPFTSPPSLAKTASPNLAIIPCTHPPPGKQASSGLNPPPFRFAALVSIYL